MEKYFLLFDFQGGKNEGAREEKKRPICHVRNYGIDPK